jgi:hypothetical protein
MLPVREPQYLSVTNIYLRSVAKILHYIGFCVVFWTLNNFRGNITPQLETWSTLQGTL